MRSMPSKCLAAAAILAVAGLATSAWSEPPAPAAAPPQACGFKVSAATYREWLAQGGKDGRLGCPSADEADAPPSPMGSASRETPFGDQGAIFVYTSGPKAGQAVAIADCYRLFYQYGGATGWLGLPISDAENTPDGQKQAYEGGEMRYGRALESCDATASAPES